MQSASPTPFVSEQQQQQQHELQQLRDQLNALTDQCAQLTAANTAWQAYHQSQVDALTLKLQSHLTLPEQPASLDTVADHIITQLYQQQQQCQLLEQDNQQLSQQLLHLQEQEQKHVSRFCHSRQHLIMFVE